MMKLLGILLFLATQAALAQAWPAKNVRIVLGFPAGGSSDIAARLMAEKMSEMWGKPVVLEHRPGAGTTIGAGHVAASAPDGYTIYLVGVVSHLSSGQLYRNLPYDAVKSFTALGAIAQSPFIILVNPEGKARTVRELVDFAKANPGMLNFASSGNGATPHLATEMFMRAAGMQMVHIPFTGMPPAVGAVLGKQVDVVIGDVAVLPLVRSGKLRALALTTLRPSPFLPGVPTLAESGVPGVDMPNVQGFIGPAGMPREVVQVINATMAKVLAMDDVRQRLSGLGLEPWISAPDEFGAFLAAEAQKIGKVIRDAGIQLN